MMEKSRRKGDSRSLALTLFCFVDWELFKEVECLSPFTPDSDKSKIDNFFQNYKLGTIKKNSTTVKYCSTASNEWSHFRVLSIESEVRKLCIMQGFTLGVKGLTLTLFYFV